MVILSRLKRTIRHWLEVDGTFLSAAVTFYAALALFPLILVLLSLFGWTLASSERVQQWRAQILESITERTSQEFSEIVSSQLDIIEANASVTGSIGILTLLAFAIAVFVNLEKAFDKIWQRPRVKLGFVSKLKRFLFGRLKAFLMIGLLMIMVFANSIFNIYLHEMEAFVPEAFQSGYLWWSVQVAAEITLNALVFTGAFQILTREKVKWRHAIYGAFLTALLWQPGRFFIATFLISERYTPFGVVGAFLAVQLWLFYGILAMLFGATVVCVAGREK